MTIQAKLLCTFAVTGFAAFVAIAPAQALTTQECSAKYQAAKAAGTLNGQKWNDFRKAQCAADATPAAAPAAPPAAAAPAAPAAPKEAKKEAAPAAAPTLTLPSGPAVFPSPVDPKYAKETAATAPIPPSVAHYNPTKPTNSHTHLK